MLHCLAAEDGRLIWKVDTAAKFGVMQNFFGVGSTPVIDGRSADLPIWAAAPRTTSRFPRASSTWCTATARAWWPSTSAPATVKYQFSDELASYASPSWPRSRGRRWCFVFARGGLLGLEPANGKIDFHFPWRARDLESVNASKPVVVDDWCLISETYGPGSCAAAGAPGGLRSRVERPGPASRQAAANALEHARPSRRLHLRPRAAATRTKPSCAASSCHRKDHVESARAHARSSLLYVDGHFVVLTEGGDLLLIRHTPEAFMPVAAAVLEAPPDGEPVAGLGPGRMLNYPAWAAPILSHGLLYLRGHDRLACVELIPEERARCQVTRPLRQRGL